jgi:phospholipase C
MHHGKRVRLQPVNLSVPFDLPHSLVGFLDDYDAGAMDGFRLNHAYAYVPENQVQPYYDMAEQYAFADHTFADNIDASFVSHQYLVAAQAQDSVDFARGTCADVNPTVAVITFSRRQGGREDACFEERTIADRLDRAGLSWNYYAAPRDYHGLPAWVPFIYVQHIYNGPDWQHVIFPETQVLKDIPAGKLANVTWVTPSFPNSDHAGRTGGTGGPNWVTAVVNAVGTSPYWKSTVIFVLWDDWGGWYDHIRPPYLDFDGAGMRVPMIVISPYAKAHYVTHQTYVQGSIMRFVEDLWGLRSLATRDSQAADPRNDVLDFKQAPRPFATISPIGPFTRLRPGDPDPDGG